MRQPRKWVPKINLGEVLTDACCFGGIAATAYGAWLIYEPAGFVVGGAMLFSLPLIRLIRKPGKE